MKKLKIKGKELRNIGYPEGPVISVAMQVMEQAFKHQSKEEAFDVLQKILAAPEAYLTDPVLHTIAEKLIPVSEEDNLIMLNEPGIDFQVYGAEHIEEGAMKQMIQASRLAISVAGALMPDAHSGY